MSAPLPQSQPMTAHTPTPWCAREDSSNCIAICFDPQHPNAEGDEIASVYREGIQTNEEMRADAAFIVEAVNSHASLKARAEQAERSVDVLEAALREFVAAYKLQDCDNYTEELARAYSISDAALSSGVARAPTEIK